MPNGKTIVLLSGLVLAPLFALSSAQGGGQAEMLVPASPSPTPSPAEKVVALVDARGAKGPSCSPKYFGAIPVPELEKHGIASPAELGVEMTVLETPVYLHKLLVQLFSEGQVVWQSQIECGGCSQVYDVSPANGSGYFFRLDAAGVAAAMQQYPQATAVGLAGMLHDGTTARLSFVRVEPLPLQKAAPAKRR